MATHRGLSTRQLLAYTVTNGCQGVMLTMPFTVAVYMVRGFLQAQQQQQQQQAAGAGSMPGGAYSGATATAAAGGVDEQLVGQLTGALAAVYSFSQFTTSYTWGLVSNRIGRKPIMVLGSAASTAGLLWFGLAGSYTSAAVSRAVAGLLNGIIVAWKCMIGESCDPLTQGQVMSYMSLAWGLGCIAGPSVGGLLSQPCASWPHMAGCGADGLLRVRPYLLPCIVAAVFSGLSLLLNCFLLEETLPSLLAARDSKQQQQQQQQHGYSAVASSQRQPTADPCSSSSSSSDKPGWGSRLAALPSRMAAAAAAFVMQGWRQQQQRGQYRRLLSSSGSSKMWLRTDSGSVASEHASRQVTDTEGQGVPAATAAAAAGRAADSSKSNTDGGDDPGPFVLSQAEQGLLQPTDSFMCYHSGSNNSSSSAAGVTTQQQQQEQRLQHAESPSSMQLRSVTARRMDPGISSGGSRALLRWDSAWLLRSFSSIGGSSGSSKVYTKLEQQQQELEREFNQSQQQQQQQMVLELSPLQPEHSVLQGPGKPTQPAFSTTGWLGPGSGEDQQQQLPDQHYQLQQQWQQDGHQPVLADLDKQQQQQQPQPQQQQLEVPWYKQRQVLLALAGYGNTCLLFCALDELTPMFASAPLAQGGLSLPEVQLAGPLAFGGLCLMAFSLLAYPRLQKSFGTLPVARGGLLLAAVVAIAIPCVRFAVPTEDQQGGYYAGSLSTPASAVISSSSSSSLTNSSSSVGTPGMLPAAARITSSSSIGTWAWVLFYLTMLLKAVSGCSAFTSSMILVNALPPPQQLGQVNGVGQSLASLARGLGPGLGGVLWGASVRLNKPGAALLPYGLVAGTALGGWLIYCFVRMPEGSEVCRDSKGANHPKSKAQVGIVGSSCCQK